MAFTWTENVSPGQPVNAAGLNEIKTNVDSIYSYLSLTRSGCTSGAGWSKLPVSSGDAIESADFQELRNAIDYAHTNWCRYNYSAYCSYQYTSQYSSVKSTNYTSYVSSVVSVVYSGHQSMYNPAKYFTVCPTAYLGT